MRLKKFMLVLIVLVILPTLFYTAYEFTVLSETEVLIQDIYTQQLDAVLFSVNQYAWDTVQSWSTTLNRIVAREINLRQSDLLNFLHKNRSVTTVFLTDTLYISDQFQQIVRTGSLPLEPEQLIACLRRQPALIEDLILKYRADYIKIESLTPPAELGLSANMTILLFVVNNQRNEPLITGLIVNIDEFIIDILRPKILDTARDEFLLAVYKSGRPEPIFSSEELTTALEMTLSKNIWLFPDHRLGIRMRGTSIEALARQRYYRSMTLIVALDLALFFAVWFLYRNVRKELELSRMKTDFVSNVSHELRTPLALIRMFAETMELGRVKSAEKSRQYVTIIRRESERLAQIINKILDFSQIEANKKQYNFKYLELSRLVDETLDFYKFHLENNGFHLVTEFSDRELIINADRDALVEALINLLDNAIKYSDQERLITVRTGAAGRRPFLEVADRGTGISIDNRKKIFEKFYRIRNDQTIGKTGSGLGLTLVKYIMDAHRGSIELTSDVGKGSRFRLIFPETVDQKED
ncbi:MAG: ATP-binding protein [Candidatus Neomarinimicrobiota bacterium]